MNDLTIVTVIYNYPDSKMPTFYNSAIKSFKDDEILIFRDNSNTDDGYIKYITDNGVKNTNYARLFYYKIIKLRENILKHVTENTHVLFMDSLDTAVVTDKDDILNKYEMFSVDIVIGAERTLWPNTIYTRTYETKGLYTPYLNSGTFIGKRDNIIDALDKMISHGKHDVIDDQGAWTRLFLTKQHSIELDYDRVLFFNTQNSIELLNIEDGKFVGFSKHNPAIIHDNAGVNPKTTFKLVGYYPRL